MKTAFSYIKNNFLFLLIAAQPVLDVIAYWTQSESGTIAGIIRLAVMVLLPLVLLFKIEKKRNFIIAMAVMGVYSVLHILNGFRVGYINMAFDVSYLVKVLQMPVLAVCFIYMIKNESIRKQAVDGMLVAAALFAAFFALACATGTENVTYAEGMGISGWVIDDNRCANSIIMVTLSTFAMFYAAKSHKIFVNIAVPVVCAVLLIVNGTKACYLGLEVLCLAYMVFLIMEKPVLGKKIKKISVICLGLIIVVSIVIYPITPRAKAAADRASGSNAHDGEIEATAAALGYDVASMTPEERFNTPEVKAIFAHYYPTYMSAIPDLFTRFEMDDILLHFNMSTNVAKLIDTREIKICYSALVWKDCDFLTKLVGFEVTEIGTEGIRDVENDWPAIFYYYGYIGFALYVGFVLYFLYLVAKQLFRNFKDSFTLVNFCLLICLMLQIGLAQFSGAILRRPNVSIYMALVLAAIYYQTVIAPKGAAGENC